MSAKSNLLMKRAGGRMASVFSVLLGCALALPATSLFAQTSAPTPPPPVSFTTPVSSNRFLFVVDTSAAMKPHVNDTVQATMKIIRSSASGQLHAGDTIGVWTFNEELNTGNMPLQTWATHDVEEIALRTGEFLRKQRNEKKINPARMMEGMRTIISRSDIITIFLVSDGKTKMEGTPFDEEINTMYQRHLQDMKKSPKPIITVLQAKAGKIIKYTVNAIPWPVVIPELPIEIRVAQAQAVRPAPAAVTVTTPAPQPAPTPAPVIAAPAQPAPQVTTAVQQPQPQTAIPQPVAVPTPLPAQVPATPVQTQSAPPMPVPAPVAAPQQTANVLPAPPAPVPPQPAVVNAATAPSQIVAKAAPEPAGDTTMQARAKTATSEAAPASEKSNSFVTQAVALFNQYTDGNRKYYLIGGVAALIVALGLLRLMVRRARRPSRISLITRTMDDSQG